MCAFKLKLKLNLNAIENMFGKFSFRKRKRKRKMILPSLCFFWPADPICRGLASIPWPRAQLPKPAEQPRGPAGPAQSAAAQVRATSPSISLTPGLHPSLPQPHRACTTVSSPSFPCARVRLSRYQIPHRSPFSIGFSAWSACPGLYISLHPLFSVLRASTALS